MSAATRTRGKKAVKVPLDQVNTEFLLCRRGMAGHQWEWHGDYELVADSRNRLVEATRVFRCLRCTAVKSQTFSLPSMEPKSHARIQYVDGYLASHRVTPGEVRKEHWERTR